MTTKARQLINSVLEGVILSTLVDSVQEEKSVDEIVNVLWTAIRELSDIKQRLNLDSSDARVVDRSIAQLRSARAELLPIAKKL